MRRCATPELALIATDGYANSFRDEANFLQVGADFHRLLQTEGAEYIAQHLESWLQEASHAGSGDDITVGLMCPDFHVSSENNTNEGVIDHLAKVIRTDENHG